MASDPSLLAGPSPDGPASGGLSGEKTAGGSGFGRYLRGRLTGSVASLVLVYLSSFFIFRVLGGDPLQAIAKDRRMTPEERAALREQLGLDQPLLAQFGKYTADVFSGNFGTSYQYRRPVMELVLERLSATVLLTGTALVLSVAVGLWVGARAGWRHGSRLDRAHVGVSLTLWSAPTFWLGMIVIMIFARQFGLFPVGGMVSHNVGPGLLAETLDVAHHLVLPAITMTAVIYAQYVLVMRSSILDEIGHDYLTTARAKGLRDDLVRRRHAIPNALLPTVTLVFLQLGGVISGAIVTETIFSWPGLGRMVFESIGFRDFPVLQTTFVLFSAAVIVANMCADIAYWFLDPRVRKA
ncbi:MAG: ABC transporter permease subunit [Micromonosporaceae bacterium]|nr:ABC transporter permease subunit [Micromonosporaceae bacterium]